jgi:excisionase family DNA binding protein
MKDLMNITEVAEYLNLSIRSVERLVSGKKLIKSKQGRNTVFKKENILSYVEKHIKDEV